MNSDKDKLAQMMKLKTTALKIKIGLAAAGVLILILFIVLIISYFTSMPQAAVDKVSTTMQSVGESVSNFFESFKNFLFTGNFANDNELAHEKYLKEFKNSSTLHNIVIDTKLLASALMTGHLAFYDYDDNAKTSYYNERTAKISADCGNIIANEQIVSTIKYENVSHIYALAQHMIGYYDVVCYVGGGCTEPAYDNYYQYYINYEVPAIDMTEGYQNQAPYSAIVDEHYEWVNDGDGEGHWELVWTKERTWFFSYQRFMYYLENSYLPEFNLDMITYEGKIAPELRRKQVKDIFYRKDDAIEWFYGEDNELFDMTEGSVITSNGYSKLDLYSFIYDGYISPFGASNCRQQTSCFKYYGASSAGWYCKGHPGTDFSASKTTRLYTMADAEIVAIKGKQLSGEGNCYPSCNCSGRQVHYKTTINDKDGNTHTLIIKYLHMNSIASNVEVGAKLPVGTYLGNAGNSGCSTGSHLHLEIIDETGKILNGETFLAQTGCGGYLLGHCETVRNSCGG